MMRVILPYRGEFGHKIMWHAPFVHAMPGPKFVYCEPGEECLHPSADGWRIVERKKDEDRLEWSQYDAEFRQRYRDRIQAEFGDLVTIVEPLSKHPESYAGLKQFIPRSSVLQDVVCDVVVCPRHRGVGKSGDQAAKNWPYWRKLVEGLRTRYRVFAAGAPDSSMRVNCKCAWKYERYLDATVEAMLSAKAVVATDAGLAHLAVLCGRPLILITAEDCRTAPGYRQVNLARYYRAIDAHFVKSPLVVVKDAWHNVACILAAVERVVEPTRLL